MVLHLRQHNIGYTADGFYRSDDLPNQQLQTLSRLHCCADRAAPVRDIDDGCLHKSAHSTGVSLDEASACWTFIPFELPIHPTAMLHGVSSLMPTSVKIWCSLIGAERTKKLAHKAAPNCRPNARAWRHVISLPLPRAPAFKKRSACFKTSKTPTERALMKCIN